MGFVLDTHRLELAVKDALKHTTFDHIEEMLLACNLYMITKEVPRARLHIVTEEAILDNSDDKGVRPVRGSGSRWALLLNYRAVWCGGGYTTFPMLLHGRTFLILQGFCILYCGVQSLS